MQTSSGARRTALWITFGVVLAIIMGASLWWGVTRRQSGPRPRPALPASVPSRAHVEISIEGMDCVMCAAGLQNELRSLPGVTKAEVSYQARSATIEYDPKLVEPERFNELVKKGGFNVARQASGRRGE